MRNTGELPGVSDSASAARWRVTTGEVQWTTPRLTDLPGSLAENQPGAESWAWRWRQLRRRYPLDGRRRRRWGFPEGCAAVSPDFPALPVTPVLIALAMAVTRMLVVLTAPASACRMTTTRAQQCFVLKAQRAARTAAVCVFRLIPRARTTFARTSSATKRFAAPASTAAMRVAAAACRWDRVARASSAEHRLANHAAPVPAARMSSAATKAARSALRSAVPARSSTASLRRAGCPAGVRSAPSGRSAATRAAGFARRLTEPASRSSALIESFPGE